MTGFGRASPQRNPAKKLSFASNLRLFGERQRIIQFDPKVASRALDLGVPKQQLHRAKI